MAKPIFLCSLRFPYLLYGLYVAKKIHAMYFPGYQSFVPKVAIYALGNVEQDPDIVKCFQGHLELLPMFLRCQFPTFLKIIMVNLFDNCKSNVIGHHAAIISLDSI